MGGDFILAAMLQRMKEQIVMGHEHVLLVDRNKNQEVETTHQKQVAPKLLNKSPHRSSTGKPLPRRGVLLDFAAHASHAGCCLLST